LVAKLLRVTAICGAFLTIRNIACAPPVAPSQLFCGQRVSATLERALALDFGRMFPDRSSPIRAGAAEERVAVNVSVPVSFARNAHSHAPNARPRHPEHAGAIVATGGIALHYNLPCGDISMEVDEPLRRRGFGSFLVQELKRASYQLGR
jgi:hypothetical protein